MNLPNELWIHIFTYISISRDLVNIILTNKIFRALCERRIFLTLRGPLLLKFSYLVENLKYQPYERRLEKNLDKIIKVDKTWIKSGKSKGYTVKSIYPKKDEIIIKFLQNKIFYYKNSIDLINEKHEEKFACVNHGDIELTQSLKDFKRKPVYCFITRVAYENDLYPESSNGIYSLKVTSILSKEVLLKRDYSKKNIDIKSIHYGIFHDLGCTYIKGSGKNITHSKCTLRAKFGDLHTDLEFEVIIESSKEHIEEIETKILGFETMLDYYKNRETLLEKYKGKYVIFAEGKIRHLCECNDGIYPNLGKYRYNEPYCPKVGDEQFSIKRFQYT